MVKEILLYDYVSQYSIESLINQINDAGNKNIILRINSGGGNVFAGWGLIAKIKEAKNLTIKVDGVAASMAAMLLVYSDNVEALSVSRFMIHKASNGSDEGSELLNEINNDLRNALNNKIDSSKLKELKGHTIDELFDNNSSIDLWLNADEALSVGLIDKINKFDENNPTALSNYLINFTAQTEPKEKQITPLKTMNISQLKTEHPSLYAEVLALGVAQENDRVSAFLVFNDLDPVAVKEGIISNKQITATMQAEFMRKQFQAQTIIDITTQSTPVVPQATVVTEVPAAESQSEKFYNEWLSNRKR